MALFVKIHPENPQEANVKKVVEIIQNGGIAIYPTDSVYGLGTALSNKKGMEKIAQIKGVKLKNAEFSFIFSRLEQLVEYTLPISKTNFRILKKNLPGPFTFILKANHRLPKIVENSRKTIGIRIPDNNIIRQIIDQLGEPIVNTSVKVFEDIEQYTTDPELIYEKYKDLVDVIINGGYGNLDPSTVVDLTSDEPEIIRQGKGELLY